MHMQIEVDPRLSEGGLKFRGGSLKHIMFRTSYKLLYLPYIIQAIKSKLCIGVIGTLSEAKVLFYKVLS